MRIHPLSQGSIILNMLPTERPICLFLPSFGDGGVERMLTHLALGLADLGCKVDFMVGSPEAPYLQILPARVRLHPLGDCSPRARRDFLADYVKQMLPSVVLSAKIADDRIALAVKRAVPSDTRYFLRPGTTQSARWRVRKSLFFKRWWERHLLRRLYRQADGIIAVSEGVAVDVARIAQLPREHIQLVRNPTIVPLIAHQAQAPLDHPWFAPGELPVILGIGGLRLQKDFATLIRAFALARRQHPCRLLILGQGRQQARLVKLAGELGVSEAVQLIGFDPNPYRYLARAGLFVLSSRWEGSPNALIEALALGVPAVATDCPSGPREILADGRYGPLVPVGDAEALAQAILETLTHPLPAEILRTAVSEYRVEISARRYLAAFGLGDGQIS